MPSGIPWVEMQQTIGKIPTHVVNWKEKRLTLYYYPSLMGVDTIYAVDRNGILYAVLQQHRGELTTFEESAWQTILDSSTPAGGHR